MCKKRVNPNRFQPKKRERVIHSFPAREIRYSFLFADRGGVLVSKSAAVRSALSQASAILTILICDLSFFLGQLKGGIPEARYGGTLRLPIRHWTDRLM